ncbi:MAG: hypothetical protein ABI442_21825 [Gemmatimonadaceae bacterium]
MVAMKHTSYRNARSRGARSTRVIKPAAAFAFAVAMMLTASSAKAQSLGAGSTEFGVDAGATFGLGTKSSVDFSLPGSRFRLGFFEPGSHISIEPAAGIGYHKASGVDGVFQYDLQLGALYHFEPMTVSTSGGASTMTTSPYIRPFVGLTGYSGGNNSDNEVSVGAGLGVMVPWRTELSWRLEGNLGYGFSNKASRIGILAGLSYFPR